MCIKRQRGISFVELILFMVIIGVGLVAILSAMNVTTRSSADPLRRKQALMIAESLMEEVQLARFTFCDGTDDNVETAANAAGCATTPEAFGPETGMVGKPDNERPFDNVNDYVNAANVFDTDAFNNGDGVLSDMAGEALPEGYSASLRIQQGTLNGFGGADVLLITVSVSYGGVDETITLDGYRLRYAPNSPP